MSQKNEKQLSESELMQMRHSAAHLMAAAVQQLWPDARFGVGPAVKNGFYYDMDLPVQLTPEDLGKIEQKMRELKNKKLPFERVELPVDDAIAEMDKRGQAYKVELLQLLKEKGSTAVAKETGDADVVDTDSSGGVTSVSFYKTGDFVDLCRGPHVNSTVQIGAFKLMNIAGAYWRGNEKNKQLQRLYGAAFATKEELDQYLWQLEEAKKRDHRKLGQELDIFVISDEVGPGLPLWMPNGTVLRDELERLSKEEERRDGYYRISTPNITKAQLYYRSGHLPFYREDMYAPMIIDDEEYFLKPMNCPHHHQIYLARPHSYRDLPLRLAEYGQVYRYEQSGALSGLMRVRGMAQNDAHIYCRYDQAKEEFLRVMNLHSRYYKLLGIDDYYMRFSKPDLNKLDKYVNEPEKWIEAMNVVKEAMDESGLPYIEAEGEAAFYGPKIDFMIKSVIGTEYAISTNQLDFLATERFGLVYTGEDGKEHPVYVIHRAPLGSHERFVAFLIEHFAGAFPTWLAPVQAVVIPIADRHNEYARKVYETLFNADIPNAINGMRVELDDARESMQKKIRKAQLQKIPYMLVVGDKEAEQGAVAVRLRNNQDLGSMPLDEFVARVHERVVKRSPEL
ncbi:MAG: threonine--tRNA ligase [Chloroflexi bacterium]|uniref:Threonine--tRNA ligase n=1 Tax=Candidatus Chlorohelix allophototropha TaxID=3003348 RepID=A0A8T7LSE7_9CHLR|nr:threonine--tRNA ligase [Chloroflexota bacterium]WJW66819.1 threonine--tRNA ligase [Chloroflexota bacterium L227-S17]